MALVRVLEDTKHTSKTAADSLDMVERKPTKNDLLSVRFI